MPECLWPSRLTAVPCTAPMMGTALGRSPSGQRGTEPPHQSKTLWTNISAHLMAQFLLNQSEKFSPSSPSRAQAKQSMQKPLLDTTALATTKTCDWHGHPELQMICLQPCLSSVLPHKTRTMFCWTVLAAEKYEHASQMQRTLTELNQSRSP